MAISMHDACFSMVSIVSHGLYFMAFISSICCDRCGGFPGCCGNFCMSRRQHTTLGMKTTHFSGNAPAMRVLVRPSPQK